MDAWWLFWTDLELWTVVELDYAWNLFKASWGCRFVNVRGKTELGLAIFVWFLRVSIWYGYVDVDGDIIGWFIFEDDPADFFMFCWCRRAPQRIMSTLFWGGASWGKFYDFSLASRFFCWKWVSLLDCFLSSLWPLPFSESLSFSSSLLFLFLSTTMHSFGSAFFYCGRCIIC